MRRGWGCPCWRGGCNNSIMGHRYAHQTNWCSGKAPSVAGAASVALREGEQGAKRVIINRENTKVRRRRKRRKRRYSMVEQIATLQPVGRTVAEQVRVCWRSCDLWKSRHLGARRRMWEGRSMSQKPYIALPFEYSPVSFYFKILE